jgi:hypothetical protein
MSCTIAVYNAPQDMPVHVRQALLFCISLTHLLPCVHDAEAGDTFQTHYNPSLLFLELKSPSYVPF